jgi:FdhE protein
MTVTATVRVMSPEEIAARAGGATPFLHVPQRSTLFAERAMRLRQLARGHAMGDFLLFMADLAQTQHDRLAAFPSVPLPDDEALDRAARLGMPPLPASEWPRDPAWHGVLRSLVADLRLKAPAGVQPTLERLAGNDGEWLEQQADCLLTGVMEGMDLATAPIVAATLQTYWAHMVSAVLLPQEQRQGGRGHPFGRIDDETACPCCGSRPVASITRTSGESLGQRYLHCSLCSMQWHMLRIKCSHCLSTKSVAYQSLDAAGADDDGSSRAATAVVQAETCDDCGHYLKIMHTDRDPFVEPVADDLATITLDLLVSETGLQRHGVNLMLLFGEPEPPQPPPDPGAA